jgi:hypothetical protein
MSSAKNLRLHNVLNTNFTSLEMAYRGTNWTHLSCVLDIFVQKIHDKFQGPIRREDLVKAIDDYLKNTLPVESLRDFKDCVKCNCDAPTRLAKFLGGKVPGCVPRQEERGEEIHVQIQEVENATKTEQEDENERIHQQGGGPVKCITL